MAALVYGIQGTSTTPAEAISTNCVVLRVLEFIFVLLKNDSFHRFLLNRVKSALDGMKDERLVFASLKGYNVLKLTPCIWLLSAAISFCARKQSKHHTTFMSVARRGRVPYVHRPTAYFGMVPRRTKRARLVATDDVTGEHVWLIQPTLGQGKQPNHAETQTFDRCGLAQLAAAASLIVNFTGHLSALTDPKWTMMVAGWACQPRIDAMLAHGVLDPHACRDKTGYILAGTLTLAPEYDALLKDDDTEEDDKALWVARQFAGR